MSLEDKKKSVFSKQMDIKEMEEFKEILAKSYNLTPNDIYYSDEIYEGKPTGFIIYYMKKDNGELRQIFRTK